MASPRPDAPAPAVVTLRRGTLRLDGGVYERYFAGCQAVALLPRDGRLLILPVVSVAAGGSILKIVNARGDRGVAAADLFRELGLCEEWLEGDAQREFQAYWSSAEAGLVIDGFYAEARA